MCDKAVGYCFAALKLVPDWFVTSKMAEIVFTAFYADKNLICFNEDPSNLIFTCNGMGVLDIDTYDIYLDNTNYDELLAGI